MKPRSKVEEYAIQKVKEKRNQANMSQAELSYRLGFSTGFVGQAESSKYSTKYNLNHLNKLAQIFECSISDFLPKPYIIDETIL